MLYDKREELWEVLKSEFQERTEFLIPEATQRKQIMDALKNFFLKDASLDHEEEMIFRIKQIYWKIFHAYTWEVGSDEADAGLQSTEGEYIENEFDVFIRNAIRKIKKKGSATQS